MIATPSKEPIDWREYIVCDPGILCGKPTLKGTRLSVEFVLELLSGGWDAKVIREDYPNLTDERIRAVLAFVAETFQDFQFRDLPPVKTPS
jgi:uncharacterized protein (DUF433 family)